MTVTSKRAEYVAVLAFVLSVIFFGVTYLVGSWSGYFAVTAISWFIGSSALIWFVLWLQFHTRSLAEREKLDTSGLAEGGDGGSIFEAGPGGSEVFTVAQRRLVMFEKWFLPLFGIVIAAYQAGLGIFLFLKLSPEDLYEAKQPLICAVCMAAAAFVNFLISRYATGMSAQEQWKPLRAGGSIMLGAALLSFALAIGLALANFQIFFLVVTVSYAAAVLLFLLGAETTINVVLDMYRPRLKGQYGRSAFDSRLLGVINEPGGFFRSVAAAIDYQFGFEVSQTWFYKLVEKAIVPLILFAAFVLYLAGGVVVVAPDEQAIIEHLGNPLDRSGNVRLVGPGLAFKWPWPFDIAYKYPTRRIMELQIGYVPKLHPGTKEPVREPLLWGKSHYEHEYSVLLASEPAGEISGREAVPVTLLKASVPVQYRIRDLYSYIYNHNEPERRLEGICYRELARLCASSKVEVNSPLELENSLLGAGRDKAGELLKSRIQEAADDAGLGIEVVFVGLQGIHPPPEVAGDYQNVVAAIQKKQAIVLRADAGSNRRLSILAGSVEKARGLFSLAEQYQQREQIEDARQVEALAARLDEGFILASGSIFRTLRQAQGYAYKKVSLSLAAGKRFASQLKAYRASPQFFKREQLFIVYEETLGKIRKFIVVADPEDTQVFIVDVQEKLTPSLYDITGLDEESER